MIEQSNQVGRYQYVVFILWLVFTVIAAKYFISGRLVEFDPHNKLNQDSLTIINEIKANLLLEKESLTNTIIHFTSKNCSCSSYSNPHKKIINKQAINHNFTIQNIELSTQKSHIIPSTPAILILDEKGELVYLGPYGEGVECGVESSFVDIVLNNYIKGFNSNLIVNNAKGCYCNI